MATKVKTGVIDSSAITSALIANASITADDLHTTLDLTGKTVTVSTASAGDNDTSVASTAYVDVAIANLADSAPSTLNTLNELAAALGDDANYAATTTAAIAAKAPLASPALTGTVTAASHVQIAGNLDVVGQIGAYNNPGSSWGKMILRANDLEYKNSGGTIKVSIDAAGDVTVPGKILVNTDIRLGSEGVRLSSDGNGEFGIGYGQTATNSRFTVYNNTAAAFRVLPNGNVGIGLTNPSSYYSAKLVVNAPAEDGITIVNGTTDTGYLMFADGTSGSQAYEGYIGYNHNTNQMQFRANNNINFNTNSGDRMRIDSSGNVGIGILVPTSKFHVASAPNGNIPTAHILQNAATNAPTLFIEQTGSGGNTNVNQGLLIKVDGNNGGYGNIIRAIGTNSNVNGGVDVEALVVKNDGKVGIGTDTPANKLQIGSVGSSGYGGNDLAIGDGTRVFATYISSTSDAVEFYTNRKYAFLPSGSGSTGYVGIGTASPVNKLGIKITSTNSNERLINLYTGSTTVNAYVSIGAQYAENNALSNSEIRFGNEVLNSAPSFLAFATGTTSSPTERMRIDSAGNLLLGTTGAISLGDFSILFDGTNANAFVAKTTRAATGSNFGVFLNSSSQVAGTITHNGSTTVNYAASSDQRLKENIADADDSGSIMDAIQVRKFDWIDGGAHEKYGFIAQELKTVVPNAVSSMGMPDEEDPMLGVDPSKLMALAIKEIQMLRARVAELEE